MPLIGQIMICGDSLKDCIVAIVPIDEVEVKKWALANGKEADIAALCRDSDLKKAILDSIV